MLRVLRRRRWLKALAGVVLFTCACALLSDWQWHRRASAVAAVARVTANYDRSPAALSRVPTATSGHLDPAREWTPVTARGRYAPAETVLVRHRDDADGDDGYLVLVPLRLDGGGVLVVDRGWVGTSADVDRPARVPAAPRGEVVVTGRLRPAEQADGRDRAAASGAGSLRGQVHAIDLAGAVRRAVAASASTGGQRDAAALVTGAYVRRSAESPSPRVVPAAEALPSRDEGPHLAYAIQWILFAVGAWAFLLVHLRREALEEDYASGRRTRSTELVLDDPLRRRSDEEVEDALVDAAERAHAAALERRWADRLARAGADELGQRRG